MKRTTQLFLLVLVHLQLLSQSKKSSKYNFTIIDNRPSYDSTVCLDSSKRLVALDSIIPDICLDLVYGTPDNFTHQVLYSHPRAYLRLPAAKALAKVQNELKKHGVRLIVFDAYRPFSVTVMMYKLIQDPNFVANPATGGSRHNKGCTVDVSLSTLDTCSEMPMPTPFDDFSCKAAVNYTLLPQETINNRQLLMDTMKKYGFDVLASEWWHYDYTGCPNMEVLDMPFDQLEK